MARTLRTRRSQARLIQKTPIISRMPESTTTKSKTFQILLGPVKKKHCSVIRRRTSSARKTDVKMKSGTNLQATGPSPRIALCISMCD